MLTSLGRLVAVPHPSIAPSSTNTVADSPAVVDISCSSPRCRVNCSSEYSARAVSNRRVVTYFTMDLIVAGFVSTIHVLGKPRAPGSLAAQAAEVRARAAHHRDRESLRQMSPVNFLMRPTSRHVTVGDVLIRRTRRSSPCSSSSGAQLNTLN